MIAYKLYKTNKNYIELEDLVNYGVLGLVEAIDNFDESKNVLFKTYAYIRIQGYIRDELRKSKQYEINYCAEDYLSEMYKGIDRNITEIENESLKKQVRKYMSEVDEKSKLVLSLIYDQNLNQREIGKILNVSASYVSMIYNKVLKTLKEKLWKKMNF